MTNPSDDQPRPSTQGQPPEPSPTARSTQPADPPETPRQTQNNLIARNLHWFANIQHAATFFGVLLGAGFAGVFILVNIGIMGREPVILEISPSQVHRMDEVIITGENLDLISNIFLNQDPPLSVFQKPGDESEIRVVIPRSADAPKLYETKARWASKMPFPIPHSKKFSEHKIEVIPGTPSTGCNGEDVVFADLDWPSILLQNAIARYIIENGYGCSTASIEGSIEAVIETLTQGQVQVMMEVWLPNYGPWWDEVMKDGAVIPLGKSLDDNWQSAFVVPTYIAEENPGLKSVSDIADHMDLFSNRDSGGKARLVTCIADWACAGINQQQVDSYGLNEFIYLEDPGTKDELFGSLEDAYQRRLPWLGYMWGPTNIASSLDLTQLEEPPHGELCWQADKSCAYPVSNIRIAAHPSLMGRAPDVMEFLRKWDLDTDAQIAVESKFTEVQDYDRTVEWFMVNNKVVWIRWVTDDVRSRLESVLQPATKSN